MANISRYDPLASSIDDFFKGFLFRPVRMDWKDDEAVQIRMDLSEDDKAYTVKAEIPGVKKDDIHVSIDGRNVSISAEVKRDTEEKKGEQVVRSERYYGHAMRSFALAAEVDAQRAEAQYADGILRLTLPKKGGASVSKVTVK